MAERKKSTGSSSETEAKREAESKGTGKGGSRETKKGEAKGGEQARKKAAKPKAESKKAAKPKPESKGGAKAESKSGGAKAGTKSAATKTAAGSTADPKAAEKSKAPARKAAAKKPAAKRKPKPKPSSQTAATKTAAESKRPVVNASARFVRVAPRKARLLADQVRGLPLEDAKTLLRFSPRSAARDIAKLLDSAAANAENNHDLVADELRIADLRVDEGPVLRRYRPRALGRATRINKRTSHIKVALTPEE